MIRRGFGYLALVALASSGATCARTAAPDDAVSVRSALNSNVVVTVVNDSGAPLFDREVWAQKNGSDVATGWTDAQGHATLSLPAGAYRFAVHELGVDFYSGTAGHCVTPGCTTASIQITHVDVNVVDTNGAPQSGLLVDWFDTAGNTDSYVETGSNGHALLALPPASYRFKVVVNGLYVYSGAAGHCTIPSCTTATITVPVPVIVTVTDTAGAPITNKLVSWANAAGDAGAWTKTDANGHAQVSVPPGSTQFEVTVDGTSFFSSSGFDCVVPGCTSATILVSTPSVVTVVDGSGAAVSGKAVTPTSDEGIAAGNKTTNASGQATFRLPFAHWQFKAKCAANNEFFFSGNAGHCFIPGGCLTAKIKMPCGLCTGKPNGFACDDQSACSGSSTCQNQKCTAASPMSCSASDQCHDAGACGAETGACSNPPKANGSACNDNNACTGTSSCQAGVCNGGSPVTCSASDQCHLAGTCNPATGVCSNPAKANGSSCSDGDSCTSGDTCQSGSCTGGAASCASIAVTEIVAAQLQQPQMSATLIADDLSLAPGDPVEFTAAVTNTGTELIFSGDFDVHNTGSSTFTVGGFQQRFEYQAVPSGTWTPFARVVYDPAGNVVPETTLLQIPFTLFQFGGSGATYPVPPANPVAGTAIVAGGNGHWGWGARFPVPPDIVDIIFDPAQSAGIRSVVSFDVPSGPPQSAIVPLDYTGVTGDISSVAAQLHFNFYSAPDGGGALASSETGPLGPGASRILTGTFAAPLMPPFPLVPSETEADYRSRLGFTAAIGYVPFIIVTGSAAPTPPQGISAGIPSQSLPVEMPILLTAQKTGPAAINAGLTGTFNVALPNTGNATAQSLTLADSVDGQPASIGNLSLPATVAAGATGPASFTASSPVSRPAGPMTDVATLTWRDRNGNLYGPITASFTGNVNAGHPEGYLSMNAATNTTDVIGIDKPFVVTALDPHGNPAPGVVVHFVVTGVNPQTADVTTGADGKATFTYAGTTMGNDTVVTSATVTATPLTLDPVHVQWGTAIGTPCTGRATPLDVMMVVDVSASMALPLSEGKLPAAKLAGTRFMDDLSYPRDQIGVITFMRSAVTSALLSTDAANAKTQLETGITSGIDCTGQFCAEAGSDVAFALNFALDELEGPRHRPDATKIIVYVGDGGFDHNTTAAFARLRSSGARVVSIGIGSDIDRVVATQIADSQNDFFYAPSGPGVDFAFNNLNQDLCRNRPPFVSAGGDQGAYGVRLPDVLTLQGEVHDDGPDGDMRLTSEWTLISGPGGVTFTDANAPVTKALFVVPGTYVLQLAASDGYLTVADRATITVDPEPNLTGASLVVALGTPSPLTTGTLEAITATLRNASSTPIPNFPVNLTIAGANPAQATAITDSFGVATFTHTGTRAGIDQIHATALAPTFAVDSAVVALTWNDPPVGGPLLTQGWIASPVHQTSIMGLVPVVLSNDVTLTSGTLTYWPEPHPDQVHTLAMNLSGAPGATLATFDTTLLANGSYILALDGIDGANHQRMSEVLLSVSGDYKPGRVIVEMTDFTVPLAGLPITIGRRYDSLEKDTAGDFGRGWSLTVGHPKLEVDLAHNIAITLPNGRRASFHFDPNFAAVGPVIIGFLIVPGYRPEPGVFGKLTANGCPMLTRNPYTLDPLVCFGALTPEDLPYAPTEYTYTDPYGTVYVMGATGEMRSIRDRQGNSLTFQPNGIISSTGKTVTFERDAQGRITKVDYPAFFGTDVDAANYTYDAAGDLTQVELARVPAAFFRIMHHTYDGQHRLLTSTDPNGNPARTSTYDSDGRLATDTDALAHETQYTYNLATRTNTTTNPDTGVLTQIFDARGLLVTETDPLGNTTTHEYDANRNETKKTNALGEDTIATYDDFGNQTSLTDPTGTTHTIYNDLNLPVTFVDRLGHTTTIDYDDRGVPARFADEGGTRFKFTNSEQGLPITVEDAAGHRAYLEYNAAGDVTARTDWLGRVTHATYDEAGHRLTETSARHGVTTNFYQLSGTLDFTRDATGYEHTRIYDPNGNQTGEYDSIGPMDSYTYNALNQLTLITHPSEGTTVSYTRDFRGNPLTMTDENGHTTTYEYDLAGQLLKTTFADGTFTTRTYDELNRLASVTDERHHTTTYEYEAGCGCSDRVTRVTDPLGNVTVTTYDANGRRSSGTDANNHPTTYEYDVRGHLTDTHYADNTSTHEEYDARGRRISMTDQTGGTTSYGYDDQGQLTSVTDPLMNATHYAYDDDGNLKSVTDANGHTTAYEYDLMKRKTKRTLPLGQFETFAYDAPGRQTGHTDFRGKTTTMTYDRRDRMLTKVPDPSLGEPSHVYAYSHTGMRESATKGTDLTAYTYTARDRLETKTAAAGKLIYTYDDAGDVTRIRSPIGNSTDFNYDVGYTWDAANQLVSVTDYRLGQPGVGVTTSATYTPTRRPSTLAQPNGIGLTYSYDAVDRVTSMLWRQGTSPAFGSWAYTHNERGQRLTSTDITGRTAAYGYDAASRLINETITSDPRGASFNGALSYVLDGAGNRLSRPSTLAAIGAQAFTYDANDEVSADTYDASGNNTASGGHTYAYDFENRLASKDSGAVTVTYDCDGNRVAKTVGGITTRYLVDDLNPTGYLQVLEEVVANAVEIRYTYGTSIVSQTRNVSTTPLIRYYGYDAHGNITFLTDTTGAVTDSYDLDAYGNLVASTGSTPKSRLYMGEEMDADLGLINLRARQYRADYGQFLSIDPAVGVLTQPVTLNRYLYAGGDPVNQIDPSGRSILEYYSASSLGQRLANAAATLFLFAVRTGAASAYNYNPVQNYSARIISSVAGFWGDVALTDTLVSPYPILGAIGVGHTVYCMLRLTLWETDNQGRLLEVPTITGPEDPTPALCGWRNNPFPGF